MKQTTLGRKAIHRGRSPDADRRLVRRAAIAKTTNENGDISTLATTIGVQFVEDNEIQAACVLYDLRVEAVLSRQK